MIEAPMRSEPSTTAGERDMLDGWLEYHRRTLLTKCAGLSDEQLRIRSVEPSGLSLIGLLRHMTIVEYAWFEKVFSGAAERMLYSSEDDPDFEINAVAEATGDEAHTEFLRACETSRQVTAGRKLDDLCVYSPSDGESGQEYSLRWIMTHMIEEYARHNGHADLLRERIDGATGE